MIEPPQAQGAIACPFCCTPVPITMNDLLTRRSPQCAACGAEFQLQTQASAGALEQLSHWYNNMQAIRGEADESTRQTDPDQSETGPYVKRKRRARRSR